MRLDEIVAWYQKKIGTYDKQEWEKTVEEKILDGFSSFTLKNAKLKTEYIDVDLVRGSTFPKAKAKQTLLTVIRLALLRYLLLPLYAKWWVAQTSPTIFALLLMLYIMQMFNWAVYSFHIHRLDDDTEHIVSISEMFIPMVLSFLLSLIHSQIVATKTIQSNAANCKHVSKTELKKNSVRTRRRKRCLKNSTFPNSSNNSKEKLNLDLPNPITKMINSKHSETNIRESSTNWDMKWMPEEETTTSFELETNLLEKTVQEFYDSLVENILTDVPISLENKTSVECNRGVDDDGFESFNGKSSSSDDVPFRLAEGILNDIGVIPSGSKNELRRRKNLLSTDTDLDTSILKSKLGNEKHNVGTKKVELLVDPTDSEDDNVFGDPVSTQSKLASPTYKDGTFSAAEGLGITTNSEDCSYSSDIDNSDYKQQNSFDDNFTPTVILNPINRISCTIWDRREAKKAEMSVLDISSCIIERVDSMPETCDYIYIGVFFSILLSLVPSIVRLCEATVDAETEVRYFDLPLLLLEKASFSVVRVVNFAFGETKWETTVLVVGYIQRLMLTFILFFLLNVAERTFKQRFLYAKLFSHLTSSRRARRSNIPHFRLNKVINIKTWLSVRSYLKRRGPQRSVDIIVSAAFIVTLLLLAFLSVEWLKDTVQLHTQLNLEALLWSTCLGIFLLRFMTLGNKINRKYKSISVLITEQINLYLQIEQKPKKKDELMVSNSVLKLAGDLLKELDSPFKISGLSANPYLYTTIKVVILSALSGVLSEMLGFKLKLHKIKIK